MDEQQPSEERRLADAWRETGERARELAGRFVTAFRSAWRETGAGEAEEEEAVHGLEQELQAISDRLDRALEQAREATKAEQASTARAAREAGDRSLVETRGAMLSGLRALNRAIEDMIAQLERRSDAPGTKEPPTDQH